MEKRNLKKIVLILGCLYMMLMICGCGPSIYTTVNMNTDTSGNRIMQVEVTEEEYVQWLKTDFETLTDLVVKNCPEELIFTSRKIEGGYQFQFEMPFTSLEDYCEKIESITGTNYNVELVTPQSVFASGISMQNDVYTSDLLAFLPELLVENGCISSDNAGYVFDNLSTSVLVYDGKEYSSWSYGCMNVNEWKTLQISSIDFYTILDEEQMQRQIIVQMPQSTYQENADRIEAYMESHVPENATSASADTEDGNRQWTIDIPMCSLEEMQEAMRYFEENDEITIEKNQAESKIDFATANSLQEKIDLSAYVAQEGENLKSHYYLLDNITKISATRTLQGETLTLSPSLDYKNPHYYQVSEVYQPAYEMNITMDVKHIPEKIVFKTQVDRKENITENILLYYGKDVSKDTLRTIYEKLVRKEEQDQTVAYSLNMKNGENVLSLSISGSAEKLQENLSQILQTEETVQYKKTNAFYQLFHSYKWKWKFSIGNYLPYDETCQLEYQFYFPGRVTKESVQHQTESPISVSGKKVFVENGEKEISLILTGKQINYFAAVVEILLLVLVAGTSVGSVYLIRKKKV